MKKQGLAALLSAALLAGTLPAAGAAVDSGDAGAYLKAMDKMPSASSYLVDFDGDGSDELLLVQKGNAGIASNNHYAVWSGDQLVTEQNDWIYFLEGGIYTKRGDPKQYLVLQGTDSVKGFFCAYAIQNGIWKIAEDISALYNPMTDEESFFINGTSVSLAEYEAAKNNYMRQYTVSVTGHSVRSEVLAALDSTIDSYPDVLSTLSLNEKKELFEDTFFPFAGYNIDYRTATDQALAQLLSDVSYDHNKEFPALDRLSLTWLSNGDYAISKSQADQLTKQLFGRTLDFSKLKRASLPDSEDYRNFCYVYQDMLCFHAYYGMGGFPGTIECLPQHLYDLGDGYFAASMIEGWRYDDGALSSSALFYSIVKKNADGTYRFIRTYPANYTPTETELAAFVAPSSWAQAEIDAADAAGLIPELNGDPSWQDNITRLQFAQLAVRLTEKATGETLSAAPASTFADCTDVDVRKAYAAGIVNGTSDTTFSPDGKLTREQLATMLWRAAGYIQQKTGETVLAADGSLAGYSDANRVSAYAKEAVGALAKNNIMQGTSETELSPQANCSVEQSVLLAYRMMQKLA